MFQKLDLSNDEIAQEVYRIQKSAYLIEAELLGTDEIPPLQESYESLQAVDELFIGSYHDSKLVGILSYKIEGSTLDIYRLFVDPGVFRQGIGRQLLDYVNQRHSECKKMIVSTGHKNLPAIQFYTKYGFEKESEVILSENLTIINFIKKI